MTFDLQNDLGREAFAFHCLAQIDTGSIEAWPSEHRNHLGGSQIGRECMRELWFIFRWVKLIQHIPRIRRLFQRGHEEEIKLARLLEMAGFVVQRFDADGKQFRIVSANGHFGGSLDGIAAHNLLPGVEFLVEFKTHNTKSFCITHSDGVSMAKPEHWAQMCLYGYKRGIKYAIYFAVNKNDDDLHLQIVELDWTLGANLDSKGEYVIVSQTPPPRISEQPSYFKCKYCDFLGVCHHGEPVEKNCRSCRHASPVANAEWFCSQFGANIPADFIPKGCDKHFPVTQ